MILLCFVNILSLKYDFLNVRCDCVNVNNKNEKKQHFVTNII